MRTASLAALSLAALLTGCGGDDPATPGVSPSPGATSSAPAPTATASPTPSPTGGTTLGASCSFQEAGFEVTLRYPDDWVTNDETEFPTGTVPACRLFDADDATPPRANELTEFGVIVMVDEVAFARATESDEPIDGERLDTERTTVAGQPAVRYEDRLTEDGIRGPADARVSTYVVDLDGQVLVASTTELPTLDYASNLEVLRAMMDALELQPL